MIIVRFAGGLGNQMYSYAICSILKEVYPHQEIKADVEHYHLYKVHNGFEIDTVFEPDIAYASRREIRRLSPRLTFPISIKVISPMIVNRLEHLIYKLKSKSKVRYITLPSHDSYNADIFTLLDDGEDYYLDALWQNIRYFEGYEELIREKMKFKSLNLNAKDMELLNRIKSTESVSIHLRRGDFVNSKGHDLCGRDYYLKALQIIRERTNNPCFFVFSDDIEYAKEFFRELNAQYVCHTKEEGSTDMYMMSCCRHNIIPNSTFSFWAAFLNSNPDKCVVCPEYFFCDQGKMYEFSVPKEWIKIKNSKQTTKE